MTHTRAPATASTAQGWRTTLGLISLLALAALGSHCFSPTYSDCAFRCGGDEPRCPPDYECRSDNFCHKPDANNVCIFGVDLAGVVPDLSARPDGG